MSLPSPAAPSVLISGRVPTEIKTDGAAGEGKDISCSWGSKARVRRRPPVC